MIPKKVAEVEVKEVIRRILEDKKSYSTSLNYAVNYCVVALSQSGHELAIQCLYILGNISRWKNPEAKRVREVLKAFSKGK